MIPYAQLRLIPAFANLPQERLDALCEHLDEVQLSAGEVLVREGAPGKGFFVVLEGEMVRTKLSGGEPIVTGRHRPLSFFGEISLLADIPVPVTMQALRPTRLVRLRDEMFHDLVVRCETFRRVIFQTLAMRVADLEGTMRQREKMAALGTLAAGLAHELNNPAAAISRAIDQVRTLYERLPVLTCQLAQQGVDEKAMRVLDRLRRRARRDGSLPPDDPLLFSEREDDLADWLQGRQIPKGWLLAPTFAAAGLTVPDLDRVAGYKDGAPLGTALEWLATMLEIGALLDEADSGTGQMTKLVKAMKSYSYMGQAAEQEVDIHEGIEDTLIILKHRLKYGITVHRDYDRTLPRITVYGSELNQVWTNLIANAADALNGQGHITIRTRRDGDRATVEVIDDGPGIPEEVQSRIFEPFFTTKPVGKGLGLGLDITYRIVVDRHGGSIGVDSRPGRTCFTVSLPIAGRTANHHPAVPPD